MWTTEDRQQFQQKGIREEQINEQLHRFETGYPYLQLIDAASVENKGIYRLTTEEEDKAAKHWDKYRQMPARRILKFVPASGAASRMFKDLFEFLHAERTVPETAFEKIFFAHIHAFAFYDALNEICLKTHGKDIDRLIAMGEYKAIVNNLLGENGLNYGALPKGLLLFHKYVDGSKTPMEEHFSEGAMYAADANDEVHLHFTVSREHKELFEKLLKNKKPVYEAFSGKTYHVSFSEQKPSTDTIAADADNKPFRENGKILFRPGGHGALIENLNDLDADVIFIKNIDNVVPDRIKADTVRYKQVIAGVLVDLQEKSFAYLRLLDTGKYTDADLQNMLHFVKEKLCIQYPMEWESSSSEQKAAILHDRLNRPMRVCGMVKNIGEPGGGPFFVCNADNTVGLQILESSQIDLNDPKKKAMFEDGTHFNPVDLVCGVKDYKGCKFDLTKYIDKATGFISSKSKDGRELKALELPGLWNGAMSHWNTVFVEVPLSTFNPVKTVNDLLREQHQ